jgi:hypothetical protein
VHHTTDIVLRIACAMTHLLPNNLKINTLLFYVDVKLEETIIE